MLASLAQALQTLVAKLRIQTQKDSIKAVRTQLLKINPETAQLVWIQNVDKVLQNVDDTLVLQPVQEGHDKSGPPITIELLEDVVDKPRSGGARQFVEPVANEPRNKTVLGFVEIACGMLALPLADRLTTLSNVAGTSRVQAATFAGLSARIACI